MNLLIVEDERSLAREIENYLEDYKYHCTLARSYNEALTLIKEKPFSVFLLDLKLPDGNGVDLIEYIKKSKIQGGIIVLSANDELETRIKALEVGADDYLVKPFHLSELNARLKALIRRNQREGNDIIEYNEIKINVPAQEATINGVNILLRSKEFELLLYFISNSGKVITKEAIAYSVWHNNSDMDVSSEIIYTQIKNLRKKLLNAGSADYIKSVYGVGYKFD